MAIGASPLVGEVETAIARNGGSGGRTVLLLAGLIVLAALCALGYLLVESVSLHNTQASSYLATTVLFVAGLFSTSPLGVLKRG